MSGSFFFLHSIDCISWFFGLILSCVIVLCVVSLQLADIRVNGSVFMLHWMAKNKMGQYCPYHRHEILLINTPFDKQDPEWYSTDPLIPNPPILQVYPSTKPNGKLCQPLSLEWAPNAVFSPNLTQQKTDGKAADNSSLPGFGATATDIAATQWKYAAEPPPPRLPATDGLPRAIEPEQTTPTPTPISATVVLGAAFDEEVSELERPPGEAKGD